MVFQKKLLGQKIPNASPHKFFTKNGINFYCEIYKKHCNIYKTNFPLLYLSMKSSLNLFSQKFGTNNLKIPKMNSYKIYFKKEKNYVR